MVARSFSGPSFEGIVPVVARRTKAICQGRLCGMGGYIEVAMICGVGYFGKIVECNED